MAAIEGPAFRTTGTRSSVWLRHPDLRRRPLVVRHDPYVTKQNTGARAEALPRSEARSQPTTLTQQELQTRLWAAANSLRGPVDPADFKSYVFPLLFFKWVSDTWDLDHGVALANFGADISPEVEADYHRFAIPKGCHWSDLQKISTNVGVALQKILDRLAEANPQSLAGIFGDVAWGNKERLPERQCPYGLRASQST